jgi:CubicO group peptidase (beta-lactamase class C family)
MPELPGRVWDPIRRAIEQGVTPGAVAVVSKRGVRSTFAAGRKCVATEDDGSETVQIDTIYDCASLTKVVVTLPLILQLADRGEIRLNDPVAMWFPEFCGKEKKEITVRQLLTHTSGLPSHLDLHSHGWSRDDIVLSVRNSRLESAPGSQVTYSDLGFILLGEIASLTLGLPLSEAAKRYLFDPLHMVDSGYTPPASLRPRIAATEYSAQAGTHWRGVVHDENARAMGGVSGHAGLFSTAEDVMNYAEAWLSLSTTHGTGAAHVSPIVSHAAAQAAAMTQTPPQPAAHRGLGWVLKGDKLDASGDYLSPRTYGHTGFTGTSLYIDPERELAIVLLTNRVHYGRERSVARLRETFHNVVAASS